jgi:mannan endo-1,4-beta-mannosidase
MHNASLQGEFTATLPADGTNSDIKVLMGKGPAIYAFDASSYTGDWWLHDSPDQAPTLAQQARDNERKHMQAIYARGGIVSVVWHQANIANDGMYNGDPKGLWQIAPPASCAAIQKFDADNKLSSPNIADCGKYYTKWLAKIDLISTFFNSVVDANGVAIPIIFRPFHENNGAWFWWGYQGDTKDANALALYHTTMQAVWTAMLQEFSKNNVHNLLFAISPNGGILNNDIEQYKAVMPGVSQIDIFGYDYYAANMAGAFRWSNPPCSLTKCGVADEIKTIMNFASANNKVMGITEIGDVVGIGVGTDSVPALADGTMDTVANAAYESTKWSTSLFGPLLADPQVAKIAFLNLWSTEADSYQTVNGVQLTQWWKAKYGPSKDHVSIFANDANYNNTDVSKRTFVKWFDYDNTVDFKNFMTGKVLLEGDIYGK